MDELLKIKCVVEHYRAHKKIDHSISFVNFLLIHYNNKDGGKKDSEHNQLPFKSHKSIFATNTFTLFLPTKEISNCLIPAIPPKNNINIEQNSFLIANYHTLIWHPPQFS